MANKNSVERVEICAGQAHEISVQDAHKMFVAYCAMMRESYPDEPEPVTVARAVRLIYLEGFADGAEAILED